MQVYRIFNDMELITLNIWAGHLHDQLIGFFHKYSKIDIFCLQEIYHEAEAKIGPSNHYVDLDSFNNIQNTLPNHQGYFSPVVGNIFGLAMFISKDVEVVKHGKVFVYENPDYDYIDANHSRIIQYAFCKKGKREFVVLNFHGLRTSKGKGDNPKRIEQSRKIKEFMSSIDTPKILCGDFNLSPDTESFKILAADMIDHIKLNDISSTRTSYYPKSGRHADYILTSSELQVEVFAKLPDEVSDHNALYLKFAVD